MHYNTYMIDISFTKNYIILKDGKIKNKTTGKILRQRLNKGYPIVDLYDGDGNKKTFQVHRLIAEKYIPNPENLPQINHKNLVRNDNRIENLEWCTVAYNLRHARKYGKNIYTKERRQKISKAKLGIPMKEETKKKLSDYWSGGRIAGKNHPLYGKKMPKEWIQKRTHSRYHKNRCVDDCPYCQAKT